MNNKKDQLNKLKDAMNFVNDRKYKDALEIALSIEKELELNPKPDKKIWKS